VSLTGEGGTGKTRVIDCVAAVAKLCGQPQALVLTAVTGVAAANIRGSTLHSLQLLGKERRLSEQWKDRWKQVAMLVIDEVHILNTHLPSNAQISFVGPVQLATIEKRLRDYTGKAEPFGGIHVLLAGDFYQLPPIGDTTFYAHGTSHAHAADLRHGLDLFASFRTVCILTENFRARGNPGWAAVLSRLREGHTTPADLALINTQHQQRLTNPLITVGVFSNLTRYSLCSLVGDEASKIPGAQVFLLRAVVAARDSDTSIDDVKDYIKLLSENPLHIRDMDYDIKCYVGMPVMLTKNVHVPLGACNSARGHIVGFQWQPNTSFVPCGDASRPGLLVPTFPPTNIFIKLNEPLFNTIEGLPPGVYPLEAVMHDTMHKFSNKRVGEDKICRFHITQFHLHAGFATTVWKLQVLYHLHSGLNTLAGKDPYRRPVRSYLVRGRPRSCTSSPLCTSLSHS
jgi:hypothetical protein